MLAGLGLVLAGCVTEEPDAPPPRPPVAGKPASVADTSAAAGMVTVRSGQTLYAISREKGVPVRALIDANNLSPPYYLKVGQVLVVPGVRSHVVAAGETLGGLAHRYGVGPSTLAELNHMTAPYSVRVGQVLILPPQVETAAKAPPPVQPAPANTVSIAAQPLAPLPGAPQAPPDSGPKAPPPTAPPPPPKTAEPAAEPAPAPAPPVEEEVAAAPVAAHRAPVAPIFYWPVRGTVAGGFGAGSGGTHSDGINITAPAGTTVGAAENGTVAYAGNELKGFGNLLLIKHADGWITAYAHNQVLLVKKGDHVRRGQPIARVGSTGGVSTPQLHFELRQGTKAVDPLDHLPPLAGDQG